MLPLVDWRATPRGNVEVLNDTADFYRYFDATPQAEFLYACVKSTVETDLPEEADYLRRYDRFRAGLGSIVEMPERTVDLIFRMLRQNEGKLSKRAQDKEFDKLEPAEIVAIERLYAASFGAT